MFDSQVRTQFRRRIESLQPDAQRHWGRMDARQMVCHLGDQLRLTLGDISAQRMPSPLRYPVIKPLVLYVLPWPKGRTIGPPEAFTTPPTEWQRDIATLLELLERFASEKARTKWPPHPMFGAMSGPLWSRFICKHFDHHLRQFGS